MFTGCGTAMVTPFRKDGSLDEATLRKLVRRQIDEGIDFLVPCGTTGESPTLTREEHLRVVAITVEESAKKVPVLAGAGGYNTHEVIELAQACKKAGADGVLSVTPYYNKPTQEGLVQHYTAIALRRRRDDDARDLARRAWRDFGDFESDPESDDATDPLR
jgi:4-hydroxy-tetrahydrodipicolinate synthase